MKIHTPLLKQKRSLLILIAVVFFVGLVLSVHSVRRNIRVTTQVALAHLSSSAYTSFPQINTSGLSLAQHQIALISKQEYAKKPISYDSVVLTYTQGSKEAWCADYVSWLYKQAGIPLRNPNSESWRIPGVYTLEDYFKAEHRYQPVGLYKPKMGDVAIYNHGQGHAAIVLSTKGDNITTIGGNESGRLRIDTRSETGKSSYDLIGFGTLH